MGVTYTVLPTSTNILYRYRLTNIYYDTHIHIHTHTIKIDQGVIHSYLQSKLVTRIYNYDVREACKVYEI